MVRNLPANEGDSGDVGSIPGSGKSPGEGNDNPLQFSCLGNLMDRGALQATVHGSQRTGGNLAPSTQVAHILAVCGLGVNLMLCSLILQPN